MKRPTLKFEPNFCVGKDDWRLGIYCRSAGAMVDVVRNGPQLLATYAGDHGAVNLYEVGDHFWQGTLFRSWVTLSELVFDVCDTPEGSVEAWLEQAIKCCDDLDAPIPNPVKVQA